MSTSVIRIMYVLALEYMTEVTTTSCPCSPTSRVPLRMCRISDTLSFAFCFLPPVAASWSNEPPSRHALVPVGAGDGVGGALDDVRAGNCSAAALQAAHAGVSQPPADTRVPSSAVSEQDPQCVHVVAS